TIAVVGMHPVRPRLDARLHLLAVMTEDDTEVVVPPHGARDDVPVPDDVVGCPGHQLAARLALARGAPGPASLPDVPSPGPQVRAVALVVEDRHDLEFHGHLLARLSVVNQFGTGAAAGGELGVEPRDLVPRGRRSVQDSHGLTDRFLPAVAGFPFEGI